MRLFLFFIVGIYDFLFLVVGLVDIFLVVMVMMWLIFLMLKDIMGLDCRFWDDFIKEEVDMEVS